MKQVTKSMMSALLMTASLPGLTQSLGCGPKYGRSGPSLKGDELLSARDRKKRERKNKKKNRR